jgi:5-enolpyruvylshikimate-3-phosphate synthase
MMHGKSNIKEYTVSADVKSNQDALTFLGKMHALDDETESIKTFKQEQSQYSNESRTGTQKRVVMGIDASANRT